MTPYEVAGKLRRILQDYDIGDKGLVEPSVEKRVWDMYSQILSLIMKIEEEEAEYAD